MVLNGTDSVTAFPPKVGLECHTQPTIIYAVSCGKNVAAKAWKRASHGPNLVDLPLHGDS